MNEEERIHLTRRELCLLVIKYLNSSPTNNEINLTTRLKIQQTVYELEHPNNFNLVIEDKSYCFTDCHPLVAHYSLDLEKDLEIFTITGSLDQSFYDTRSHFTLTETGEQFLNNIINQQKNKTLKLLFEEIKKKKLDKEKIRKSIHLETPNKMEFSAVIPSNDRISLEVIKTNDSDGFVSTLNGKYTLKNSDIIDHKLTFELIFDPQHYILGWMDKFGENNSIVKTIESCLLAKHDVTIYESGIITITPEMDVPKNIHIELRNHYLSFCRDLSGFLKLRNHILSKIAKPSDHANASIIYYHMCDNQHIDCKEIFDAINKEYLNRIQKEMMHILTVSTNKILEIFNDEKTSSLKLLTKPILRNITLIQVRLIRAKINTMLLENTLINIKESNYDNGDDLNRSISSTRALNGLFRELSENYKLFSQSSSIAIGLTGISIAVISVGISLAAFGLSELITGRNLVNFIPILIGSGLAISSTVISQKLSFIKSLKFPLESISRILE